MKNKFVINIIRYCALYSYAKKKFFKYVFVVSDGARYDWIRRWWEREREIYDGCRRCGRMMYVRLRRWPTADGKIRKIS